MIDHARATNPEECCGILAGIHGQVTKLYRTTNADHSPYHYTIEPNELIAAYQELENNGWELLATYHSHPRSEAYPSPTDIQSAFLPQSLYIIISLVPPNKPTIRVFRIVAAKITEIELKIVDA